MERKFLIELLPPEIFRARHDRIAQGYLSSEPGGRHVRIRKKGNRATLSFKVGSGTSREEREISLSPKQFAVLWPATCGRRLSKVRYEIPWKNFTIEVDIYRGRNHGLIVAEVEFPTLASYRQFKAPPWFGREITGQRKYSNVRLARE
jgi:adenylate cyclase